jgi:hypothetical protein
MPSEVGLAYWVVLIGTPILTAGITAVQNHLSRRAEKKIRDETRAYILADTWRDERVEAHRKGFAGLNRLNSAKDTILLRLVNPGNPDERMEVDDGLVEELKNARKEVVELSPLISLFASNAAAGAYEAAKNQILADAVPCTAPSARDILKRQINLSYEARAKRRQEIADYLRLAKEDIGTGK